MVVQQGLELSGADLLDPQDSDEEMDDFDDSAYDSGPSPNPRRDPDPALSRGWLGSRYTRTPQYISSHPPWVD
jgi:hypothetical protein